MIIGRVMGRSAATDSTVHIAGLRELLQGLSALPFELGRNAIYAALGGAASVVRKQAIANAPQISGSDPAVLAGRRKQGTLKRAIRVSRSKINKGQAGLWEVIVRVKPLKKRQRVKFKQQTGKAGRDNPDDPYYWWWVEFGTRNRKATPFLRPAFAATKDAQLRVMRQRMAAGLQRAAKKIEQQVRRAA
jgi:HK97 gp10 family phage protein